MIYRGTPDHPELALWKSKAPSGPGTYKLGITASKRLVVFQEVGGKERKIVWKIVGIGLGTSLATAGHFWFARDADDPLRVRVAAPHSGAPSAAAPRIVARPVASSAEIT